jgi:hypothetical protein
VLSALGSPHDSVWPWPSNMVAAPTACGTSGSTFSNHACDAHRLSRVNVRAHPSCEPTHLCVPAARTDAALRRFARRRSPGRRRFSPTGQCLKVRGPISQMILMPWLTGPGVLPKYQVPRRMKLNMDPMNQMFQWLWKKERRQGIKDSDTAHLLMMMSFICSCRNKN